MIIFFPGEKMAEYKVKLGAAAGDKKKEAEIRQKISARSNKYAMEQERMEGKIGAMQREKESLQHQARAIQNRGLAEEQVLQAIPLVNEANSISQQLDEGVIFQLELSLEHFHFTAAGEVADEDVDLHVTAVRESTSENVKWTFTNFNDKLYLMREQVRLHTILYRSANRWLALTPFLHSSFHDARSHVLTHPFARSSLPPPPSSTVHGIRADGTRPPDVPRCDRSRDVCRGLRSRRRG